MANTVNLPVKTSHTTACVLSNPLIYLQHSRLQDTRHRQGVSKVKVLGEGIDELGQYSDVLLSHGTQTGALVIITMKNYSLKQYIKHSLTPAYHRRKDW